MRLPTMRQLFELARDNAAIIFAEEGYVTPIWHAVPQAEDEEHLFIGTPWGDDKEKIRALKAITKLFQEKHIQRFAFVCEAWYVQAKLEAEAMHIMPSEHPDRREVIRVSVEDRGGEFLSGHYFILRPEHGPPKLSRFHEDVGSTAIAGRMAGLLSVPRWRPRDEPRRRQG